MKAKPIMSPHNYLKLSPYFCYFTTTWNLLNSKAFPVFASLVIYYAILFYILLTLVFYTTVWWSCVAIFEEEACDKRLGTLILGCILQLSAW
jgi:hypothetical protein